MSSHAEAFQALLEGMRKEFLAELPERCEACEERVLRLENAPDDAEAFNDLYRRVHSLKGSGGTHGLGIVSTLCHQLENRLTEANEQRRFDASVTSQALAYLDLLRQVARLALLDRPDYTAIEAELDTLRRQALNSRKAGLIVESSAMMSGLYQKALEPLPLQLTLAGSGLTALERLLREPFDCLIVGGELKDLNGIALVSALRLSNGPNQHIPALLVSSQRVVPPEHARFSACIARDQELAHNLAAAVRSSLPD